VTIIAVLVSAVLLLSLLFFFRRKVLSSASQPAPLSVVQHLPASLRAQPSSEPALSMRVPEKPLSALEGLSV
jgi:hypothetical protein